MYFVLVLDINMQMWNNLRVESLFSAITCLFGLFCLVASLKPCCDNRRLPVYLGSVSFFTSGKFHHVNAQAHVE